MASKDVEFLDPWIHRSSNMKCRTCMWWVPKMVEGAQQAPTVGRCRKHAPTMSGYPAVFANDWCGDHKINEEAL